MICGKVSMEDSLIRKRIKSQAFQHARVFHSAYCFGDNARMYHETTAKILRQLMAARGHISENELARQTGVNQPTINRILKGESREPKLRNLQRLADFFGVTVPQLRGEEPMDSERSEKSASDQGIKMQEDKDADLSESVIELARLIVDAGPDKVKEVIEVLRQHRRGDRRQELQAVPTERRSDTDRRAWTIIDIEPPSPQRGNRKGGPKNRAG